MKREKNARQMLKEVGDLKRESLIFKLRSKEPSNLIQSWLLRLNITSSPATQMHFMVAERREKNEKKFKNKIVH